MNKMPSLDDIGGKQQGAKSYMIQQPLHDQGDYQHEEV